MKPARVVLFCVVSFVAGFLVGTEYQKKSMLAGRSLRTHPGEVAVSVFPAESDRRVVE